MFGTENPDVLCAEWTVERRRSQAGGARSWIAEVGPACRRPRSTGAGPPHPPEKPRGLRRRAESGSARNLIVADDVELESGPRPEFDHRSGGQRLKHVGREPWRPPLTAALKCENDMAGRFTFWSSGDAHPPSCLSHGAATSGSGRGGATPLAKGSVRVRGEVETHTSPLPSRGTPAPSIPAGRQSERRCGTQRTNRSSSGCRCCPNARAVFSCPRANAESRASATQGDLPPDTATRFLPLRSASGWVTRRIPWFAEVGLERPAA